MGNHHSIQKINYEDISDALNFPNKYLIINTMSDKLQGCLIKNTININEEEQIINELMSSNKDINIIIYGKNCNDNSIFERYEQLSKIGFINIYLYSGGMFEWLCLQDIYSDENFPTTRKELDILKYKPDRVLNKLFITNN
jgi:hypothetical protein